MKVREDGKYVLDDGRVLTPEEAAALHKNVPEKKSQKPDPKKLSLSEGECSGKIELTD